MTFAPASTSRSPRGAAAGTQQQTVPTPSRTIPVRDMLSNVASATLTALSNSATSFSAANAAASAIDWMEDVRDCASYAQADMHTSEHVRRTASAAPTVV